MNANHLTYSQKINMGSFYTPSHIVDLTYKLLEKVSKNKITTILEPSCGCGVFFDSKYIKNNNFKLVGADIDKKALSIASQMHKKVKFYRKNVLKNVNRDEYCIKKTDILAIVGNPPYNDITSHIKFYIKKNNNNFEIDSDIVSRDIGLSSMLAYNKLNADYVAILHPLSYIIKKANFKILSSFMKNYKYMNGVVFNSQEFSDTSKSTGFPILIAIYKKDKIGTTYNEVYNNIFQTLEGNQFSLSEFDYISNYIQKYPNKYKIKNFDGYLFYTLRDINALKRCRTFIKENINNAIQIDNNKLDYYCYIDVFKDFAKKNIPYYLGNFDIPINNDSFKYYKDDFRLISFAKHPDIFGNSKINNLELHKNRINNYFREVMSI